MLFRIKKNKEMDPPLSAHWNNVSMINHYNNSSIELLWLSLLADHLARIDGLSYPVITDNGNLPRN